MQPVGHARFEEVVDLLVKQAGHRLAYLMIPKPRGLAVTHWYQRRLFRAAHVSPEVVTAASGSGPEALASRGDCANSAACSSAAELGAISDS